LKVVLVVAAERFFDRKKKDAGRRALRVAKSVSLLLLTIYSSINHLNKQGVASSINHLY